MAEEFPKTLSSAFYRWIAEGATLEDYKITSMRVPARIR
jgi:hypothetical protein